MKTAISIPDALFEEAEVLCKRHRLARSQFYALAIQRMVEDYRVQDVTERLNSVYEHEPSSVDPALASAQLRTLKKEKW